MARITPIDVIQGIHGKYGNGSSDYFATNTSSLQIRLAKYKNKYTGPFSADQQTQMEKFGIQAKQASAWLRANRPSDPKAAPGTREHDGTEAYQEAMALKKSMHLSNIRQVVVKYMDADGTVTLPSTGSQTVVVDPSTGSGTSSGGSSSDSGMGDDL